MPQEARSQPGQGATQRRKPARTSLGGLSSGAVLAPYLGALPRSVPRHKPVFLDLAGGKQIAQSLILSDPFRQVHFVYMLSLHGKSPFFMLIQCSWSTYSFISTSRLT